MKRILSEARKLSNRGLTLVELICAVAILSLVGTVVGGILIVSAQSYDSGMNEVELQQEAQMVVNQISDLVIDTTATGDIKFLPDSNTLVIPSRVVSGGTEQSIEHHIKYDSATKNLYYCTVDGADPSKSSAEELMATGIGAFSVDTASYKDSGNLFVDIALEREVKGKEEPRKFQATFQITSRNGVVDTTPKATINVINDIVLEPNQTYQFKTEVVGISNQAVAWEIIGGNTDENTTIESATGIIKIGKNEVGSIIHLLVKTATVDAENNPMAMRAVNVRIRRVNDVVITGKLISGTKCKSGAVYELTAEISGTYLDKEAGDYDSVYYSPYGIAWLAPSVEGTANPTMSTPKQDEANPGKSTVTITLTEDMPQYSKITVTAMATHPEGTYATVQTNKSGVEYGRVDNDYLIYNEVGVFNVGDGLERGSNKAFGTYEMWDWLNGLYGSDIRYEVRFKPEDAPDVEESWQGWFANPQMDSGKTINIRPHMGLMMDYGTIYDLQIRVTIYKDGVQVWPIAGETPQDQYLYSGKVDKVRLLFSSPTLGFTRLPEWSESHNTVIKLDSLKNEWGSIGEVKLLVIDGDDAIQAFNREDFKNNVYYEMEQYIGNKWTKVNNLKNDVNNGPECIWFRNFNPGKYRIHAWMDAEQCLSPTCTNSANHRHYNYDLGYFYFTAE